MPAFYSRSTGGFYHEGIHGQPGKKGSLVPKDVVEVSDVDYTALMAEQANGKAIVADPTGAPIATVPQPTPEEILAAIRRKRDRELAATDYTQMDAPLTDEQRAAYAEHRQALRDYPAQVEAAIAAGQPVEVVPYPEPPPLVRPTVRRANAYEGMRVDEH